MAKKVIAGCLAAVILGGLAYYSSYLYASELSRNNTNEFFDSPLSHREREVPGADLAEDWEAQETKAETEEEERTEVLADPDSLEVESGEAAYYLVEEFGYVNIYLPDKETIYEYTTISIGSLPENLQKEICLGKAVASEQELYDFLENYSS